jgi:hypothetical protein
MSAVFDGPDTSSRLLGMRPAAQRAIAAGRLAYSRLAAAPRRAPAGTSDSVRGSSGRAEQQRAGVGDAGDRRW